MAQAAPTCAPHPIDQGAVRTFNEYIQKLYDGGQNGKTLFTSDDIDKIVQILLDSSAPDFKPPSDSRQKSKLRRIKKRFRLVQIGNEHRLASTKGIFATYWPV